MRFFAQTLRRFLAAVQRQRSLAISLQHQLQTNWCWAACTSSVSAFFAPTSTWGQCAIVNAELAQTTCCQYGDTTQCNQPWYFDRALQRTGNLNSVRAGAAPWGEIQAEIDAGRPVGARIGWTGGGGHFVLLTGYQRNGALHEVEVQDPWTGSSTVELTTFTNAYKSSGSWTHTYLVEP